MTCFLALMSEASSAALGRCLLPAIAAGLGNYGTSEFVVSGAPCRPTTPLQGCTAQRLPALCHAFLSPCFCCVHPAPHPLQACWRPQRRLALPRGRAPLRCRTTRSGSTTT